MVIPISTALKLKIAVGLTCLKQDVGYLSHYKSVTPDYPDYGEILNNLHNHGYHILRGYYTRDACTNLMNEIDAIIAEYPDRIDVDNEKSDHRIWGSEKVSARIREFYADPILLSFAMAYLKVDVRNITTLAAKLAATPGNEGSGKGCHRDSMYEKQFKAFLYLSDVELDNGPFQYFEKTNSKRSVLATLDLPHVGTNLKRFEGAEFESWCEQRHNRIKTITGRAGDVILADTRGIHTGIPIIAGTRYALTNYYVASHRYDTTYSIFADYIKF